MIEQRFTVGPAPKVRIGTVYGDLRVEAWDEDAILVQGASLGETYQQNDELMIDRVGDVLVKAPSRTAVTVGVCSGDAVLVGLRQVSLSQVQGDLRATDLVGLQVEHVAGDVRLVNLGERFSAAAIGGDLDVRGQTGATVAVGNVGGDVNLHGTLGKLEVGQVGGDGDLRGTCADVHIGQVAGDLSLKQTTALRVGSVGGDLEIDQAAQRVEAGNVGGDVAIAALDGVLVLANVGGDLTLRANLAPASRTRTYVGGDATITLPDAPNLTLTAVVGGAVLGVDGDESRGRKQINLRYGAGEASLDLTVQGDLRVEGPRPTSRSARAPSGAVLDLEREWAELGRELGELGRELGRLGTEIGAEIAAAIAREGIGSAALIETVARTIEEKARQFQAKAERQARVMEERFRRASEGGRVRVKINDREWQFDPERLERIKEQARRAAAEGLVGALEVVERALSRLRVPPAPPPPPAATPPPAPPSPPPAAPPPPAATPPPVSPPQTPATGQTIRIETGPSTAASPADRERERETILRMVAEGRISPEEGDLLLEALG